MGRHAGAAAASPAALAHPTAEDYILPMLAARPRGALITTVVIAAALALVACEAGGSTTPLPTGGDPAADCARAEGGVIELSADNLEFDAPCLAAPAGEPFTIHFVNLEAQAHNVAVYIDSSKANEHFRGDIITGPDAETEYVIDALEAGEYYFDCIVHPAMNGVLYIL
jgi:plastocyanin